MSKGRTILIWITLGLVVTIGLIGLYSKFEYTLVSDIRERIVDAKSKEGVALGELLFDTRGCGGCHTLGKFSNATFGPDLTTIAVTASASEIRNSIINPDAALSENCLDGPCAAGLMPDFGVILDEREIEALVTFLLAYAR